MSDLPSQSAASLSSVLADCGLEHLFECLSLDESLDEMLQACVDDRPAILARLKAAGCQKLSERQKLVNTLCRMARERGFTQSPEITARKTRIVLPQEPVPLHGRGLTIQGKTDGFGAQLQAQMSAIAYTQRHGGAVYVHSPMGPKMDHELHNIGSDGPTAAELDAFGGMGSGSPRYEAVAASGGDSALQRVKTHEYCREVHFAQSSDEVGQYYTDACRELLRAKYHSTAKPALPECCAADGGFVAVHIRRGDVDAVAHPRRFTPNSAYLPLLQRLAARHPDATLVIFSQGTIGDFAELRDALEGPRVALCLDADVRATFHALVQARALLVARSSFSYAAGILSRGDVYCDLLDNWWHPPLPSWRRLDADDDLGLPQIS